jgi:hypothetical protein
METKENRLKRLQEGKPVEALLTLFTLQSSFFVDIELKPAAEKRLCNLLILGIHAVAETWAEILFDDKSVTGFERYLEYFVDGNKSDEKFSTIAEEINAWRNIIAHQWLSSLGHSFGVNCDMKEGMKRENGILYFNPVIYFKCFLEKFERTWSIIKEIFSEEEHEQMKQRIIEKYVKW